LGILFGTEVLIFKMENIYDVAIIGGGPAGIMAAISASKNKAKVVLIEKNPTLGKKLLLTGDGRCNITNENISNKEVVKLLGKQGDFLLSALSQFGFKETKEFFENHGLKLVSQENGKLFPSTQKSKDVLNLLLEQLKKNNVKILVNSEVFEIKIKGKLIEKIVLSNGKEIIAKKYILTTGGKSYPVTGSTGDGFSFSQLLGHTINEPKPALCPVQVKEVWVKELSGMSLNNVLINKKWRGDILFAHFGLTGPLILDKSRELGELMKERDITLAIDIFPDKSLEALDGYVSRLIENNRNSNIKKIISLLVPQKLADYILSFSKVKSDKKGNNILKQERLKIVSILKNLTLHPVGLLGFDRSMITSGGVSLKEIDSKTMKSKLIDNLFFAGEIIDLDGPCGGYNLQICWTTGYVAGTNSCNI
jgi:predicted Rossmann fold flavoprotein